MPDDKPLKSAFELAMEKLRERDRQDGGGATHKLSAEQKRRIAERRPAARAKLAEIEILHRDKLAGARGDAAALEQLEQRYAIDRRRVESKLESDIAGIRRGADPDED